MCTFVLGTLPATAPLDALARGYIAFWEVKVVGIAGLLHPGERIGRLTQRHCDCETPIGSAPDRSAERRLQAERSVERLSRKGWSRHKIDRWLEQVQADQHRHVQERSARGKDELREWREWLQQALNTVGVSQVGLLVDFYDNIEGAYIEDKAIPTTVEVGLREVDDAFLEKLAQGVLYRVSS